MVRLHETCPSKEILRTQGLYVFATYEDVWKTMVLEEIPDHWCVCLLLLPQTITRPKIVPPIRHDLIPRQFQGNWKRTYLHHKFPSFKSPRSAGRLQVQGFYSDLLYQPFHCATAELNEEWMLRDNIERVSGISFEEFRERFEIPNR